jgi:c-di-GMP-binding flagellar brake protein YcgR
VTDSNHLKVESDQDNSKFLVYNALEIVRILRGLAGRNELVSAFFNSGNDLMLTSVLQVDPNTNAVILDLGSNEELNRRIAASEKTIFVTALDRVKIQWVSTKIESTMFEGREAFRITIPDQILRLQRREYYRLPTPVASPLKCQVPGSEGAVIQVALVDISAGGMGIVIPETTVVDFSAGEILPGCRVDLPGVGTAEFTLSVQSTWEVTMKNGSKSPRAGCRFIDMRPGIQAMIQRFIIKLERERIAHTGQES